MVESFWFDPNVQTKSEFPKTRYDSSYIKHSSFHQSFEPTDIQVIIKEVQKGYYRLLDY
jgi:hypothetical protein